MTFNIKFKEELSKLDDNHVNKSIVLSSYLNCIGKFSNNLSVYSENASVIRMIYTYIKEVYDTRPQILIRIQKRFKTKQIYMLEINNKIDLIKQSIKHSNLNEYYTSEEEKVMYLKGAFLAVGSITDPKTSGYHLEFACNKKVLASDIKKLLDHFKFNAKIIKRGKKYITYLKAAEEISDLIKLFKAINSLFYFEDIRIYRDHKNMVNRLNNCEIANQEKTIKSGLKQLDSIEYLKKYNLVELLDDKTKIVVSMREKYPEASFQELAEIITMETEYKIGKSGINHNFIKVTDIINKHKKARGENE